MPCGYGNMDKSCDQASLIYINILLCGFNAIFYTVSMIQIMMLRRRLYQTMEKFGYPPRSICLN